MNDFLNPGLFISDRDGVINELLHDPEYGVIKSPLHPSEVKLRSGIVPLMKLLKERGWQIRIATNQPGAAKGETTRQNLEAVHSRVLELLKEAGIPIDSSHICWHRTEDNCNCRKPKTGLLEDAFIASGLKNKNDVYMLGDGTNDIEAAKRFQIKSIWLAPKKAEFLSYFPESQTFPDFWAPSLQHVLNLIKEPL